MSWLSGIIGGGLGAVVAGPFGAIIGAAIGAGIGGSNEEKTSSGGSLNSMRHQAVFFTAAFSMVGKMAKADGHVCDDEIAAVENVCAEMQMDARTRNFAINVFNQAKDSSASFGDYAAQFGDLFRHDQQMCGFMMDFLFKIAMADGKLHANEEALLLEAQTAFNISDAMYNAFYNRYVGLSASPASLGKHYETLGINSDASDNEVKKAYHKLVSEFHPDKIASKGLPPEFIKFANERMAQINEAYSAITDARKK